MFEAIVEHIPPGNERDALARQVWEQTRDFDFTQDQMNADEALFSLRLARRGVDPDWPDSGEVTLYDEF